MMASAPSGSLSDYQTTTRMVKKLTAVPLPEDFMGESVLDIGCESGWWCKLASDRGAGRVVGVDRGREVKGRGWVDLIAECRARRWPRCEFVAANVGREWPTLGGHPFDHVLCMSVYHHIWANCRSHREVWAWFHRVTGGVLWWEGPTGMEDPVAKACAAITGEPYLRAPLERAADTYFARQVIGPAGHAATREVWVCSPQQILTGVVINGAGGATAAFQYQGGRRIKEIAALLGMEPYPGSLNVQLTEDFPWGNPPVVGMVSDVIYRGRGLAVPWAPREAWFYPVRIEGYRAYAFRFAGEKYSPRFVELIAPERLRDLLSGETAVVRRAG